MRIKIGGWSIPVFHIMAIVAILPLVVAAAFTAAVRMSNADRFDPSYFTPEFVKKYSSADSVVLDLEKALREDDKELMAALQGLRQPVTYPTGAKMSLERLSPTQNTRYMDALIIDRQTYQARGYHLGLIQGRWVVTPDDAFYYVDSGHWAAAWLPMALIWWLAEAVTILMLLIYYYGARWRREWGSPGKTG